MNYVRITVDDAGQTHFRNDEMPLRETKYNYIAPFLFASPNQELSGIQFIRLPAGWSDKDIKVPVRQFLICLEGEIEIAVSDGERRTLSSGKVVLMEDTHGQGHSSNVGADADCLVVIAPVVD